MKIFKSIPKTVFQLGLVSLFNDLAKEMIYPVVPLFLTLILGAGPVALGLVESVAEATSSVLKVFSGISADRLGRRKPFLLWGYSISGLFRPMIALVQTWPAVLLFRFLDRMGKGLRSAPQDALIADVTNPSNLGASYGFHSAMDDAGQLLGPFVAALLVLPALGFSYQSIIAWSIVPGIGAWLVLLWVKDDPAKKAVKAKPKTLFQDWKKLGVDFKVLLGVLVLFTLGNSTDAFLIIRLSQLGVAASWIFALWGLNGGVRMLSSYYGGTLSDRFGRKPIIVTGWLYYALIYLAFGLEGGKGLAIFLFLAYGLYYGLCEPSEKAFIGDLAPKALRGTAFGYYYLVTGLGALPASLLFGFVGQQWGYPLAFKLGAALAGLASLLLFFVKASLSSTARRAA
jgi:MFS family permease